MRLLYLFVFISAVSCQSRQETDSIAQLKLSIDEVLLPIPDDMPNDWGGATSSMEEGERVLHLYDIPNKEILQYSIAQKKLIKRIAPFSDTLDPGNVRMNISKINGGYFLSGGVNLGFLLLDNEGNVLQLWDDYIPRTKQIKNWNYSSKYRLRASKTSRLSMFNDWLIPIQVEMANLSYTAVFRKDFYQHDLFAILDLKEGMLKQFPIRFPDNFYNNGFSYPMNFLPSFTANGPSSMAYFFGLDDVIHVLNIETGKIAEYKIPNPEFPLNIRPIDQVGYNDPTYREEFDANLSYYAGLFFDPYNQVLLRMGLKKLDGQTSRIFEIIDENMQLVAQFEQPFEYSATPIFFPNEMWFPFRQGYKEDTMKLMRVRY